MSQKRQELHRINSLHALRREKYILAKRLRIRKKIVDYRVRRFEESLTLPNITRELVRGTNWEILTPIVGNFTKFNGKTNSILTIIGGVLTGAFAILSRKKTQNRQSTQQDSIEDKQQNNIDEQMFI